MNKKISNKIRCVYTTKIFFIILLSCHSIHCIAQPVEFTGKIEYKFETLLASGSYKENSQTYNIFFNQTYQCIQEVFKPINYDSLNKARVDNIAQAYKKYGIEKDSFELAKEKTKLKMQLEESYKKIDQSVHTINRFILYNNNIYSLPTKVGDDEYCVIDTLAKINWVLLDDTMTIEGLFCQKARGGYNSHFYEVWFAPSIPFAAGPTILLYGLPGIIVMATSEDKKRRYRMTKIEYPLSKNIQLANCENEKKISWKEYKELMAKHKVERQKKLNELMKTPPRQ